MAIRFLGSLAVFVLLAGACGRGDEEVVLTIAGGASGPALDLTVSGTQRFMDQSRAIRVNIRPVPNSTNERLAFYNTFFAQEASDLDVLQIDVVWVGAVAEYAVDLKPFVTQGDLDKHFSTIVANNIVDGRLVGIPWFTDAPLLYYRTDLLEKYGFEGPPDTWDELEQMARTIQQGERVEGNLGFWGYVWQGRAYEGLTCNALEWQHSHGGGNFLDETGRPRLNNPETIQAFSRAARWVGTISPPDVITFDEDDSRVIWQSGDAAFMRNWAYAYALSKQDGFLRTRFDVAPLPRGPAGRSATLGGWQLMVSKFSRFPREAFRLVQFLTSEEEQKRRVIRGSYPPTRRALYEDSDVLAAAPFLEGFDEVLEGLVARPGAIAGKKYDQVSEAYWTAVHDILMGAEPGPRLEQAEEKIREILK